MTYQTPRLVRGDDDGSSCSSCHSCLKIQTHKRNSFALKYLNLTLTHEIHNLTHSNSFPVCCWFHLQKEQGYPQSPCHVCRNEESGRDNVRNIDSYSIVHHLQLTLFAAISIIPIAFLDVANRTVINSEAYFETAVKWANTPWGGATA